MDALMSFPQIVNHSNPITDRNYNGSTCIKVTTPFAAMLWLNGLLQAIQMFTIGKEQIK